MKHCYLFLILTFCLGSTASASVVEFDLSAVPVESTKIVDVTEFNLASEAAIADGGRWPTDVLALVNEFLYFGWSDREVTSLEIKVIPESVENPRRVSVCIIRDGFLDDAIRGDWTWLDLKRDEGGRWIVKECRKAIRNRRGDVLDRYVSD